MLTKRSVYPQIKLITQEEVLKEEHELLLGIESTPDADNPTLIATELLSEDALKTVEEYLIALKASTRLGALTRIYLPEYGRITIIGFGDSEDEKQDFLRVLRSAGSAARALGSGHYVTDLHTVLNTCTFVQGFLLGGYTYFGFKKAPEDSLELSLVGGDKKLIRHATVLAESISLTRDLVNTPPSDLYPESYAQEIQDQLAHFDLADSVEITVLDEKELEDKGFGGITAVGKGSTRKPRLVILNYKPENAQKKVALVGKGITFDTGGISIKPSANMDNMTSDMAGSATMVGTLFAAARLGLPLEIQAVLPLAENMPDGASYRPGDVITHYGGISSEILNTDAEGRIVLADALAYASESDPDYLIEAATLTGAQLVALGTHTNAVMGSDTFRDYVAAIGNAVDEAAWPMPLPEELKEDIKSDIADLRNVTNARWGGMLLAGIYLSHFISAKNWVHLDIAGPAYNTGSARDIVPRRATGNPVRTLVKVLTDIAQGKINIT